jgi:hypothetical protein
VLSSGELGADRGELGVVTRETIDASRILCDVVNPIGKVDTLAEAIRVGWQRSQSNQINSSRIRTRLKLIPVIVARWRGDLVHAAPPKLVDRGARGGVVASHPQQLGSREMTTRPPGKMTRG